MNGESTEDVIRRIMGKTTIKELVDACKTYTRELYKQFVDEGLDPADAEAMAIGVCEELNEKQELHPGMFTIMVNVILAESGGAEI